MYTVSSQSVTIFTSRCLVAASNEGVSFPLGSRTVTGLSYQLLTATVHNKWTAAVIWLTHELTNRLTACLQTLSRLTYSLSHCSELKSELLYDWRFTAHQFVLAPSPLRPPTRVFQLNSCGHSLHATSSLTRRWVCETSLKAVLYLKSVNCLCVILMAIL
jgi:hypothetical protein